MPQALRVIDSVSGEISAPPPDEFGFDPVYTERVAYPLAHWLYKYYWRVEVEGVENVPASGPALLAANHAGLVPYDGAMIRTAIWAEHSRPRHARMLVVDWAFALPFASQFLLRTGNVLAHPANATTLLRRDQLVGVFPEGVKGASKLFRERYRVARFGRGGFVQVALRTGAPIVPVAVVGSEEVHPVILELPGLARALGLPFLPVTATFPWLGLLGAVPLPSKWLIAFGRPIETSGLGPQAADDPQLVLEISDEVRGWIQTTLRSLLGRRTTAFY